MGRIKERATAIFVQAGERITADCKALHAEHAAKGLLRSGATVKRAVRIYCERSSEGLRQVLGEVAQKVEHRGRAWTAAMAEVEAVLDAHAAAGLALLEPSFKVAGIGDDDAERAAIALLDKCITNLHDELAGYKDGWTAPKPKRWGERSPTFYAIALLIVGALISALVGYVISTPMKP